MALLYVWMRQIRVLLEPCADAGLPRCKCMTKTSRH